MTLLLVLSVSGGAVSFAAVPPMPPHLHHQASTGVCADCKAGHPGAAALCLCGPSAMAPVAVPVEAGPPKAMAMRLRAPVGEVADALAAVVPPAKPPRA